MPALLESNLIINERSAREGSTSVFEEYRNKHFKHRYHVELHVANIVGGVPFNPQIMQGWLKTKINIDPDIDVLQELVSATIAEVQGEVDPGDVRDAAIASLAEQKINGFKRLADGTLIIEGRQIKAMILETANSLWPKSKWGPSGKGTMNYLKEHLFIKEDAIPLKTFDGDPVTEPREVRTRFHSGYMGARVMTREEICEDVFIEFTLVTDHDFTDEQLGTLWVHAEDAIGLGAARTSATGRFYVTQFQKL